jgi:exosortase B
LPAGVDPAAVLLIAVGLCALYAPTFWDWADSNWAGASQGHEPLIVLVSAWLLYARRDRLAALIGSAAPIAGTMFLVFGLMVFLLGRAAEVVRLELLSMIIVLAALLMRLGGWRALRCGWFPLFFLLFAIPLPPDIVVAVTGPLKSAVSAVAAQVLYWFGVPVGRSGVVLTVGQYQLLVMEACAGLQTMFTLEAMGLLYASLSRHSTWHNLILACLVVPVAFVANVVRVMLLVVITYVYGDAAGQGFLHGFSGIVLFLVALGLVMMIDRLLVHLLRPGAGAA